MAVKLEVNGEVFEERRIPNPFMPNAQNGRGAFRRPQNQRPGYNSNQKKYFLNLIEIRTGGNIPVAKGLPMPDQVHFTILLNDKMYEQLLQEASATTLKSSKVYVRGEITLNPEYKNYIKGDIGVVAYQVGLMSVIKAKEAAKEEVEKEDKPEEENLGNPSMLPVNAIQVPEEYRKVKPREEKVQEVIQYFNENGKLDRKVVVKKSQEGKPWVLVDNYIRFVVAERLGIKEIEVEYQK